MTLDLTSRIAGELNPSSFFLVKTRWAASLNTHVLPTVHARNWNAETVYFASKTRNSAK